MYLNVLLFDRCLPGYPYKCPKLQITPEKGLSKTDTDRLLSLIHDQVLLIFFLKPDLIVLGVLL